jgi:hypothetical protein
MRTSQLNASITRDIAGRWRFFTLIQSGFGSFPFLRGNRGDC